MAQDLSILLGQKKLLEAEVIKAFEQYRNAGPAETGNAWNHLDNTTAKLYKIQQMITEFDDAMFPNEVILSFYVICNTSARVEQAIGGELFGKLSPDRYDSTEPKKWKPFKDGPIISEILDEIQNKGYSFQEFFICVDELTPPDDELQFLIDTNIQNSVAIIDLLSIDEFNKTLARQFNTTSVGYLLLPCCRQLDRSILNYMDSKRRELFNLAEFTLKNNPGECDFYEWEVSVKESFVKHIIEILFSKFKIQNRISTPNSRKTAVRKISMRLS